MIKLHYSSNMDATCFLFTTIVPSYRHNIDFYTHNPQNKNFLDTIENVCSYYTQSEFIDKKISSKHLSVIHFNVRSLKNNFESLNTYLSSLNYKFDIIAISESWLCDNDVIDEYEIENYNMIHVNGNNKIGGGVALYIEKQYEFTQVHEMSYVINDLFEIVTFEKKFNNAKNIVVSCCYRTPGGSLQEFNDEINIFLEHYKTNKSYILCGDFNINTINYDTHKHTKDFADTLLNAGLLPMITLPTRISASNSTLIDNIYTNIINSSTNGVLIDDTISDHLPIFSCIDYTGLDKYNGKVFKYIRHSTPMAI